MIPLYALTLLLSALLLFAVQPMVGKMVLPLLGGTPAVWNTCMVFFQATLLLGYLYTHLSTTLLGPRRQAKLHLVVLLLPLVLLPIGLPPGIAPPAERGPILWLLIQLLLIAGLPLFVVSSTAPLLQRWLADTDHPAAADPYFLYAASNTGSLLALAAYPLIIERLLPIDGQSRLWTGGYVLLIAMVSGCGLALWRSGRRGETSRPAAQPRSAERPNRIASRARRRGNAPQPAAAAVSHRRVPHETPGTGAGRYGDGRNAGATPEASDMPAGNLLANSLLLRRQVRWLVLAAVPSSLMLGVTTYVTTNLASMPLLWVIPLGLYLLTFVLVFARRALLSRELLVQVFPLVLLLLAPLFFLSFPEIVWRVMLAHLVMFFLAAMICHGELAADRPGPEHLTRYYLLMSLGGVLGGAFNAIVAPVVFTNVIEYPLMMLVAALLTPAAIRGARADHPSPASRRAGQFDLLWPAVMGVLVPGLVLWLGRTPFRSTWLALVAVWTITAVVLFMFRNRPLRFGLGFAVTLAAFFLFARQEDDNRLVMLRNFFGVKRVVATADGGAHFFYHGTILHGTERSVPPAQFEPLAYYWRGGPIGQAFTAFGPGCERVGIIGLGVGAVAAYAEPGQRYVFHEIDPQVARIAENPAYFTFLHDCRGEYGIILGDGRLTLAAVDDGAYGLMLLDAYSSDAVPTHLLSREAMRLYLSKLAPGGVLVFHTTNAYLSIEPLVAALARDAGLVCLARGQSPEELARLNAPEGVSSSQVVVAARRSEDLAPLLADLRWYIPGIAPDTPVWTDRYSDIISLLFTPQPPPVRRKVPTATKPE